MNKAKVNTRIEIYPSSGRDSIEAQINELKGLLGELEDRQYVNIRSSFANRAAVTWDTECSCECCDTMIDASNPVLQCHTCEHEICDSCAYWDKTDQHRICEDCWYKESEEEK